MKETKKTRNWDLQYGELKNDTEFVNNCETLKANLIEVQEVLDELLPVKRLHYDKLTVPAKIELDLFLAFAMNSLHWIHLRIQGIDPTQHPIKNEIQRIKATMLKWQQVKDRQLRPTVNVDAAKRFIRNGLYDSQSVEPQNKKTRFEDEEK